MSHRIRLESLRHQLATLERTAARRAVVTTGLAAIDRALPWHGLASAALHEIGGGLGDGAALGFMAAITAAAQRQHHGAVLWCRSHAETCERGVPYAPGLRTWGLDPDRIVFVDGRKPTETLWAMEEGLRARAFAAVIGDGVAPDFTAARRLQLAASTGPAIALVLLPSRASVSAGSSPALTRWRISAAPVTERDPARTTRAWRVDLLHCRGAAPRGWTVIWNELEYKTYAAAPLSGAVATALADGPLAA